MAVQIATKFINHLHGGEFFGLELDISRIFINHLHGGEYSLVYFEIQ